MTLLVSYSLRVAQYEFLVAMGIKITCKLVASMKKALTSSGGFMRIATAAPEFTPTSTLRGPVDLSVSPAAAAYLKAMGVSVNQASASLDYQHGSHVHSILDLHQNKYRAVSLELLPNNAGLMLKATLKNGSSEDPFKLTRQVILNLIKAQQH